MDYTKHHATLGDLRMKSLRVETDSGASGGLVMIGLFGFVFSAIGIFDQAHRHAHWQIRLVPKQARLSVFEGSESQKSPDLQAQTTHALYRERAPENNIPSSPSFAKTP
jgi:hypothetical protein